MTVEVVGMLDEVAGMTGGDGNDGCGMRMTRFLASLGMTVGWTSGYDKWLDDWIPAFAGMTDGGGEMTDGGVGIGNDGCETGLRLNRPPPPPWSRQTLKTFITSSPRWLITFTAMRPDSGLSNGREVSLRSVAQASASISAFNVLFSDL